MIFPGMDPYLEDPRLWPGVHAAFIVRMADALQPKINPTFVAAIEERVYFGGLKQAAIATHARSAHGSGGTAVLDADVPVYVDATLAVHQSYLTLLDLRTGQKIATVIELVSPTNKYAGPGRASYVQKQAEVLGSDAHLIEIDLLRAGPHVLAVPESMVRNHRRYDYLVCVNCVRRDRRRYEFYPTSLRKRLPRIRVPLAEGDPDVALDLQAVLEHTYRTGSYHLRLRYGEPPDPPLGFADQQWADQLIAARAERAGE